VSFSPQERQALAAELQRYGWRVHDDALWSPSGGLYFNDAHFAQWGPAEMGEVFDRRGKRIEAQQPSHDALIEEHRQVCRAVAIVCRHLGLDRDTGSSEFTETQRGDRC
jgi:hypothetical protein